METEFNEERLIEIRMSEYVDLTVKLPTKCDIGTFSSITEMVRRINKSIGTIMPVSTVKRAYNFKKPININKAIWDKQRVKEFMQDYTDKVSNDDMMAKYDLKTSREDIRGFLGRTAHYLKTKYNIKTNELKNKRFWSNDEQITLRKMYENHTPKAKISQRMGFSIQQISDKVQQMKSVGSW